MRIGKGSRILMKTVVVSPENITIGENTIINEYCHIDGRGGLFIGDGVSISIRSIVLTASHSKSSDTFAYRTGEVRIEDNAWLGAGTIVLDRSRLKRACILSAGSVIKGVCEESTVYTGNPASPTGPRGLEATYEIKWNPAFR